MKRMLSVFLAVVLIATLLPALPSEAVTYYTEGIFHYYTADDKAIIYRLDDSAAGEITIPKKLGGYPVSIIDGFGYHKGITSVIIPEGVKTIGYGAFGNCEGLKSITVPKSLTEIGELAFLECKNLQEVHISSLTSWCKIDFDNYLSNPLYYAGDLYLNGKLLTEIKIPKSIKKIKHNAFTGCSASKIIIPESVKSIGMRAFANCENLTSISIPKKVTSIEWGAFENCIKLKNIAVSDNISSIGNEAFYNTAFYNTKSNWKKRVLYLDDCLIAARKTISGSYIIKSYTKVIADGAFSSCENLKKVTVPKGVVSIGDGTFKNCTALKKITLPSTLTDIGNYSFSHCESLQDIKFPRGLKTIGFQAFEDCKSITEITIPKSIKKMSSSFRDCLNLKKVTIENGVKNVNDAFSHCPKITTIVLPDSITRIDAFAFWECKRLKNVTIPAGVKHIEYKAFEDCDKLTKVYYKGSKKDKKKIIFDDYFNADGKVSNKVLLSAKWYYDSCNGKTTHNSKRKLERATLKKNGKVTYKCSDCGKTESKTIYKPKTLRLSSTTFTYDGNTKTPKVVVKNSKGKTLKKNTDYTVTYAKGRKKVGKYKVTIKFKGKYKGTKNLYFAIKSAKTK